MHVTGREVLLVIADSMAGAVVAWIAGAVFYVMISEVFLGGCSKGPPENAWDWMPVMLSALGAFAAGYQRFRNRGE